MDTNRKFTLYDTNTIAVIYGVLGFLFTIGCLLIAFFVSRFLSDHNPEWFILIAFFLGAWGVVVLTSLPGNAWRKYCLRCTIDSSGIHCSGLFWKPFSLPWQELRTCGLFIYQLSVIDKEILLFSLDRNLSAPKSIEEMNAVTTSCVPIEYRAEAWEALLVYMPEDIRKRFEDAHNHRHNTFFRR